MLELKTYKNYKQLCEDMGWSTVRGNTKVKHLKELTSICKWRKEGNKIIIDEIYSEPKEIKNNCKGKKNMYVPYTEPLLLSMLNQEGATIFHGILTDSVILTISMVLKKLPIVILNT